MRRRIFLFLVGASLLGATPDARAYQFLQARTPDGRLADLHWSTSRFPVVYHLNDREPFDFSIETALAATAQAFQTWEDVETASIRFASGGLTSAEAFVFFDQRSTLGFRSDADLEGTGILAATLQVINVFTGEIVESDIFFSDFFVWSVDPAGRPNTFDFVSVATHEIGHFVGLGHSHVAVTATTGFRRRPVPGSSIMFPLSFGPGTVTARTLTADDRAGLSILYPASGFRQRTGALSGRVTKGGRGVAFAQIVSFHPFTGETIGAFADESGRYRIEGLSPGPVVVRVQPIGDPTSPEDFGFPERTIDLDYRDALFTGGPAEVTAGGTTDGIDFEVVP